MKTLYFLTLLCILNFLSASNKTHPAVNFLNTLNSEQKAKTLLSFDDSTKTEWHYFPSTMFLREGISIKELTLPQRVLLKTLLQASLSESGYNTTLKIIDLENHLAELSGDTIFRDAEKYYVAFYGNPEKDKLWAWSFEGHHVSLNFTVLNGKIFLAPRFFGANPAIISSGDRKGERSFKTEEDLGLELINSMTSEQLGKTIISATTFGDIVTKTKSKVSPLESKGIGFTELNQEQKTILTNLISTHVSYRLKERANEIMEKIKKDELDAIIFGWAGATTLNKPHYYRIQGKSFLIELDNTQNNTNHIHMVWRDFDGDFGRDLIKEHYQTSHHH